MQHSLSSLAAGAAASALATLVTMVALAPAQAALAQPAASTAPSASAVVTPPRIFALVAAVGDQFQYVRQKESVGSHLDPYIRHTLQVPDQTLNHAVLRGLDQAVATEYPGSERVFMAMRPDFSTQPALPQEREAATMRRVMDMLENAPARKDWDQIIVVTPKWLMSERQGMGGKLAGIGLYVQPLGVELDTTGDFVDDVVEDTAREQVRSRRFVAPFFYVQVTTLDAKTLRIIRSESRYDFRKIVDKESTALDVQAQFTPEQLARHMQRFVETSAMRAINENADTGTVQVGPVRVTPEPAPTKK